VIAIDLDPRRAERARQFGADIALCSAVRETAARVDWARFIVGSSCPASPHMRRRPSQLKKQIAAEKIASPPATHAPAV
jgi:hypothetical protein